jgi:hypothetical protein
MHKRHVLLLLLFLCFGGLTLSRLQAGHESVPAIANLQPGQVVPLGERLVYKVTWLGIPVGTAELAVKEKIELHGRDVFHVVGIIETNKVLSKIFPLHDEAHSWIDAETFESIQFEKKINELAIKAHHRTVFDAQKAKGYFEAVDTGEKKIFDVMVPVHDVLSVVYWARRQVLGTGMSVKAVLTADQKDWALELAGLRFEKIKLQGKKVPTLRIEPNTIVEGEERRGKAYINLTRDASQVPVRIVYKAPVGNLTGTLKLDESALNAPIA